MKKRMLRACLALGLAGGFALSVAAADRSADQIVDEIQAIKVPQQPEGRTQEAVLKFFKARKEAEDKKANLILELYRTQPHHDKLAKLLPERWNSLMADPDKADALGKEIDEVTAQLKEEGLKVEGTFVKTVGVLRAKLSDAPDEAMAAIESFVKLAPKDERSPQLLYIVSQQIKDKDKRTALEDRILKDYPEAQFTDMIRGDRRRLEAVGKPFELSFTEAITGTKVSMEGLKGKVVVLDFWATWCGPCVAEMPKMKELYAKYHDKGVEFIGVSLDQPKEMGGLDKLKNFVSKNEIPWPQYYQGNGWDSEFSKSWGISGIPCVFLIDAEGKLASVDARGKLEEMIPEYLKKGEASH
ncbi:TlpA family protein disulfide reductase [Singulisphaera rosea]